MQKRCCRCGKEKSVESFWKNKCTADGLQAWCSDCKRDYNSGYENRYNPEYQRKYQRKYYRENKEKIAEHQKNYAQKNREKRNAWYRKNNSSPAVLEWRRRRYKERMDGDANFKIAYLLRSRINKVLKGRSKAKATLDLLGCNVEELNQHIEKQFEPGMSWDNHGLHGLHIDHIVPIASFDLSDPEQQQKCFHYTNLQPLWAEENISKGCKCL